MHPQFETWEDEIAWLAERMAFYGFTLQGRDIGKVFIEGRKLNRRYPAGRGQITKYQVLGQLTPRLMDFGYRTTRSRMYVPPERNDWLRDIPWERIEQFPEFMTTKDLWEIEQRLCSAENLPANSTPPLLIHLAEYLRRNVILEIGHGHYPFVDLLAGHDFKAYQGCDPFVGPEKKLLCRLNLLLKMPYHSYPLNLTTPD